MNHKLGLGVGLVLLAMTSGCGAASTAARATPTAAPQTGLPNPASVYCEEHGGRVEIRTGPDGGQYGVCVFADGSECEEWAYLRGECQPGAEPTAQAQPAQPDPQTPSGGTSAGEETERVEGWVGTVVQLPPGNQFGSAFEREDGERFDIGSADEGVRQELNEVRGTGARVRVWGRLYVGVPADQARHIEVERVEAIAQ